MAHTKLSDRWEFPRHRLKVFNILGEGCFGQVWRCEALDIDGKNQHLCFILLPFIRINFYEENKNFYLISCQ